MKLRMLALAAFFAVSAVSPVASADKQGDQVLAMADKLASKAKDQRYTATMDIRNANESIKTLEFSMVMKGLDKQLLVFTAPGDVAGMKVLLQDADTLYVYSPEFKKVRRIAAHMQNQGFLNSDFTYEDMVQAKLSNVFNASVEGKQGSKTTLILTPKSSDKSSYDRVEVVIDSKKGGITKLSYFAGQTLVRVQLREGWKKVKGVRMPTKITMKNVLTNRSTVIKLSDIQINTGVADSHFARRTLLRG